MDGLIDSFIPSIHSIHPSIHLSMRNRGYIHGPMPLNEQESLDAEVQSSPYACQLSFAPSYDMGALLATVFS